MSDAERIGRSSSQHAVGEIQGVSADGGQREVAEGGDAVHRGDRGGAQQRARGTGQGDGDIGIVGGDEIAVLILNARDDRHGVRPAMASAGCWAVRSAWRRNGAIASRSEDAGSQVARGGGEGE